MFDFFQDFSNYADRAVARHESPGLIIDTAAVSDGSHPFETGVSHAEYNDSKWVIVEAYDTKDEAQHGHDRWVAAMTSDFLPEALTDCCNAAISQMIGAEVFPRRKASAP